MVGVRLPETISNKKLGRRTGLSPVGDMIRKRKCQWISPTLRAADNCIAVCTMQWNPLYWEGRRQSTVEEKYWRFGTSWGELKFISANRERWHIGAVDMPYFTENWIATTYMSNLMRSRRESLKKTLRSHFVRTCDGDTWSWRRQR